MHDQVLTGKKKQKVAYDAGQSSSKDSRPVSKSETRKLKQIERRKEAQARVQGAASTLDYYISARKVVAFVLDMNNVVVSVSRCWFRCNRLHRFSEAERCRTKAAGSHLTAWWHLDREAAA